MIDSFLHVFYSHLPANKPWKLPKFSEVMDLYISLSFKSIALSLVGIFVPIFLYDLGYGLRSIIIYYIIVSVVQAVSVVLCGYLVAARGPKHVLRYSYILLLMLFLQLYFLPDVRIPLWTVAAINGLHFSSFIMAYHVDFSKIQHATKAGREIGNMMIILKTAGALGPLIGGVIASVFGMQWTLFSAFLFLIFAALPLMTSGEPVKKNQIIRFQGLFTRRNIGTYVAAASIAIEQNATIFVWPLFTVLYIFTDNAYAALGFVTSASFMLTIVAGKLFGRMVDNGSSAQKLYDYSAYTLALNHLVRPFIGNGVGVLMSNGVSQVGVIGTRVPFVRAYYDEASHNKGQRIATIIVIESWNAVGRILFWLLIFASYEYYHNEKIALSTGLLLGALGAVLITLQNFRSLGRSNV